MVLFAVLAVLSILFRTALAAPEKWDEFPPGIEASSEVREILWKIDKAGTADRYDDVVTNLPLLQGKFATDPASWLGVPQMSKALFRVGKTNEATHLIKELVGQFETNSYSFRTNCYLRGPIETRRLDIFLLDALKETPQNTDFYTNVVRLDERILTHRATNGYPRSSEFPRLKPQPKSK